MKYAVIDWRGKGTSDCFEDVFDSKEEALNAAENQWAHMTKSEREDSIFYVCSCMTDEDGCVDFNTVDIIKEWNV